MADEPRPFLSRKAAEIGFALLTASLGAMVIVGALEHDIAWSRSGPGAGYFPFRIGIIIVVCSLIVLIREALRRAETDILLTRRSATNLAIFIGPLVVLIAATPLLGIYIAGAVYLLFTVAIAGRASWQQALTVAVLFPTVFFVLFEYVFRAPLPKGPLGPLLGLL